MRKQRKRNADPLKGNRRKAHVPCKYGPSTNVARTQAHLGSNHVKAVANRASPDAAAPGVSPHPHHCLSGPPSSGGAIMTPRVGS